MTNERLLLTDTFETWAQKFNSSMNNIETAIENVPAIETIAPKNHASEENVYGVGNASLYGHLKISDSVSSTSSVTAGVAASPKAVKTAYDKGVTALNIANNAMTKANDAMTKATTVFTGSTPGLVPEATSSDARKTLLGNGTWGVIEGDAAKMTLSSDLQLTADSPRAIVLTTTTTGLSVRLPDPSTLPRGAVFHLFVYDSEDIQLCGFTGQPIKAHPVLSEYTATRIQLIDATADLWVLANYSKIDMSDAPAPLGTLSLSDQIIVSGSRDSYGIRIHVLSENSAIVVYNDWANNYAVILSVTGTDIVVGNEYRINNLGEFIECDIAKLSENKVLVSIMNDSNYLYALVMTISGTTITMGNHTTITSSKVGKNFKMRSVALSENKVLLNYTTSDGGTNHYDILSSSDTNEVVILKSNTGNKQSDMVAVSENTIFGIYANGSTQVLVKINIAENNTIKFTNVVTLFEPVMNIVSMTALSEEKFLIAYSNANNEGCVKVVTLNDAGPTLICTTSTTRVENSFIKSLSKKTAVVCFYGYNNPNEVYALRVNQNTITVTDKKVLSGKISSLNMNILSSNRALLVYHKQIAPSGKVQDKSIARTIALL